MPKNQFYPFALFAFINTIMSMFISLRLTQYWEGNILIEGIPFVAHYLGLNLLLAIILYIFSLIMTRPLSIILNIIFCTMLQLLLIIDIKIFSLFHFHLNSLVWNVITVEGVSDSVTLGRGTIIFFGIIAMIIITIETFLNLYLKKGISPAVKKFARVSLIAGLLLICLDKGLYAYGDLTNRTEITKNARLY